MRRRAKQDWSVGTTVRVGFLTGFRVIRKVATPGDYKPDCYELERNGKRYKFTPHNGGLVEGGAD